MTAVPESPEPTADDLPAGSGRSLSDAVAVALDRTGHGWLRRVTATAAGGVVTLQGKVPSFYLKQLAQVVVTAVAGVELVRNELQVEYPR